MPTVNLSPQLYTHVDNPNGKPMAFARIYTYIAGSGGTLAPTYTDSSGTSANTNPVVCDANGNADIWLDVSITYDVEIRYPEPNDNVFKTVSNVRADSDSSPGESGRVSVSSDDSTLGFLDGKLVAGSGITLSVLNDGGDESLEISASGIALNDLQGAYDDGDGTIQEASGKPFKIAAPGDYIAGDEVIGIYDDSFSNLRYKVSLDDIQHESGNVFYYRDLSASFPRDSISTGKYFYGLEGTDATHSVAYRRADTTAGHFGQIQSSGTVTSKAEIYASGTSARVRLDGDSEAVYLDESVYSTGYTRFISIGAPVDLQETLIGNSYNRAIDTGSNSGIAENISDAGSFNYSAQTSVGDKYTVTLTDGTIYNRYAEIGGARWFEEFGQSGNVYYKVQLRNAHHVDLKAYDSGGLRVASIDARINASQTWNTTHTEGVLSSTLLQTATGYWQTTVSALSATGMLKFRDVGLAQDDIVLDPKDQSYFRKGIHSSATIYSERKAATSAIDWTDTNSHYFSTNLSGSETLFFLNGQAGATYNLELINNGNVTINFPASVLWADGTKPDVDITGTHMVSFYFNGTNYLGVGATSFS